MSLLCEAYIELANNKIPTNKSNKSEDNRFNLKYEQGFENLKILKLYDLASFNKTIIVVFYQIFDVVSYKLMQIKIKYKNIFVIWKYIISMIKV